MFAYKIDVLDELKKRGYTTSKMRNEKLLGENAIQSLRRNEVVGIIALEKICGLLEMQPGDWIVEPEWNALDMQPITAIFEIDEGILSGTGHHGYHFEAKK